jgi:hypothetical protein
MRRASSGRERWNLIPMTPGTNASFRWWEIVVISYFVFLPLAIFVVGIIEGDWTS